MPVESRSHLTPDGYAEWGVCVLCLCAGKGEWCIRRSLWGCNGIYSYWVIVMSTWHSDYPHKTGDPSLWERWATRGHYILAKYGQSHPEMAPVKVEMKETLIIGRAEWLDAAKGGFCYPIVCM